MYNVFIKFRFFPSFCEWRIFKKKKKKKREIIFKAVLFPKEKKSTVFILPSKDICKIYWKTTVIFTSVLRNHRNVQIPNWEKDLNFLLQKNTYIADLGARFANWVSYLANWRTFCESPFKLNMNYVKLTWLVILTKNNSVNFMALFVNLIKI